MSTSIDYFFQRRDRFPFPDFFTDVHETWEILLKAKSFLKEFLVEPGIKENHGICKGEAPALYNEYYIGEGTVIYNDVTIIGPAYIGKNCELMPGAIIRPYTILSDNCSVGHGSEVKHCVFFGGAKISSLAFAGDSILGASARIGSGVITANRRFDQGEVKLRDEGERKSLGDSFFGVVLGDSARIGANSVTQPGTHIGPYSWIYPLTNVRGFIEAEQHVYHPREIVKEPAARLELKP